MHIDLNNYVPGNSKNRFKRLHKIRIPVLQEILKNMKCETGSLGFFFEVSLGYAEAQQLYLS